MKYINADRLKREIKRQADLYQDTFTYDMCDRLIDFIDACMPDIVPKKEVTEDLVQHEQSTNTDNLCSEIANFLIRNDIQEDKAKFLANRIADIYGSKRYIDGLCDGLDINEQPKSEVDM